MAELTIVLKKVLEFVPITVFSAFIIFFLKEIVEFFRRTIARKNKLKSIEFIFTEELLRNYFAFQSLFDSFSIIANLIQDNNLGLYKTQKDRFGHDHFRFKKEDRDISWSGNSLPEFKMVYNGNLLPALAELNFNKADKVQKLYELYSELEHYREMLILFLNDELDDKEDIQCKEMSKDFVCGFYKRKEYYKTVFEDGYKALSNKDILKCKVF